MDALILDQNELELIRKLPKAFKVEGVLKVKYIIKSKNREKTRDNVEKLLYGLSFTRILGSKSSFEQTLITFKQGPTLAIVYKPFGGSGETTLNATITELVSLLLYFNHINEKDPKKAYTEILKLDLKKQKCILPGDSVAAKESIDIIPDSSKFTEKMNNAIAIKDYLQKLNSKNPIANMYWSYRVKPKPFIEKSFADIAVFFTNGDHLGISLKADKKGSKPPLKNTSVNALFEYFNAKNALKRMCQKIFDEIYSTIDINPKNGIPDLNRNFNSNRKNSKETRITLRVLEKTDPKLYEELYDKLLDIVRNGLIDLMNFDFKKTKEYFREIILNSKDPIPTVVVKATGKRWMVMKDSDVFAEALKTVTSIHAKPNTRSKQTIMVELQFNVELSDINGQVVSIFTVRSSESGIKHKLGQFYNLKVMFIGIK